MTYHFIEMSFSLTGQMVLIRWIKCETNLLAFNEPVGISVKDHGTSEMVDVAEDDNVLT